MRFNAIGLRLVGLIVAMSLALAARAQPAEEFYRGKRELNLITSSSVGGGYDSYSRLIARHMGKYLPGNPVIIVQNMVGGGGIRAANYIYNVAPKDGGHRVLPDRPRHADGAAFIWRQVAGAH